MSAKSKKEYPYSVKGFIMAGRLKCKKDTIRTTFFKNKTSAQNELDAYTDAGIKAILITR